MSNYKPFCIRVNFNNYELLVEGSWQEGHDGYVSTINDVLGEPPEPPEIELEDISIELDFDVIPIGDLLHPEYIQELEDLCLEQLQEY